VHSAFHYKSLIDVTIQGPGVIASHKQQWQKSILQPVTVIHALPVLHEPLHAVIGAVVAYFLQTFI